MNSHGKRDHKKPFHHRRKHANNYEHRDRNKNKEFTKQVRLSEVEVGITEYISTLEGFDGVIKARFSDFHVNEINSFDEVAKLTDTEVPKEFIIEPVEDNDPPEESPSDLLPHETWTKIKNMMKSEDSTTVKFDTTALTKKDRTKLHKAVKNVYGGKIVSSTITVDDKKYVELKKYNKSVTQDKRVQWPQHLGEYVYFLVYKESLDTIEANFKISDCLKMKSSNFSYAGVKDRRAKTTQWFCVRKLLPSKLIQQTKFLRCIHIGNITFHDQPLKLGDLNGNRFRIALRNVTAEDSVINGAMESLKSTGFINYFGLQRFGNDKEVPTFQIGIELLKGNWKEAAQMILKLKSADDPFSDITKAKKVYKETGNCAKAADEFRRNKNKCIESKLLMGLANHDKNDYVNALENIPRNMRLLYLHAFQSLIWNKMVSRRIKEFGLKPTVGDLVLLPKNKEEVVECKKTEDVPEETMASEENGVEEETNGHEKVFTREVKFLTEEDLENYSIYDIVLPLPGYSVQYPENEIKTWYKEELESCGLSLEMPKLTVKTYTISGTYRKIVCQVKNLSWKTMRYNDPHANLIRSDYEELKGEAEPEDKPDGQYKALLIDFCLKSSCYATMVLRELLKTDTSCTAHAKLNDYHKDKTETVSTSAEPQSLLQNMEKYDEFKKSIFGQTSEAEKRPLEEGETQECKKLKTTLDKAEPPREAVIKMEASLV